MLGLDAMDDNGGKSRDPSDFHQKNRKFLVIIFEALNCMSVPHSLDSKSIVRSYNQLYVQVG
jgi:hypothetical protein